MRINSASAVDTTVPPARIGEERLLIHLLRDFGMADEDEIHTLVAPLQKHVQQQEEPLGQILHAARTSSPIRP